MGSGIPEDTPRRNGGASGALRGRGIRGRDFRRPAASPHRPSVYATCLFCHAPLGRNETLESFPVGRRLAYDAERGRLWVVCRRCERWNLTPLEERWEAIEAAERLY